MVRKARTRLDRLRDDFPYFAETILRIRDKSGGVVPFRLNKMQDELHRRIEAQRQATGKVRVIGLKGRQLGFSTYVQGRFFWRLMSGRGLRAFILTHEHEATNNLFEIADRFCMESPVPVQPDRNNAKELHFSSNDCGYKVGTAGNKAVARSSTLQLFHGSEVAFWPNADDHKAGAMQAVPELPGTEIILESTANGVGGMFHELWFQEDKEYLRVFIPWYWQDEYRATIKGFKRTRAEQELVRSVRSIGKYDLDDTQLAWRRNKIASLRPSEGGDPEDLFKQEYPCWPEEAFLFSGRLVFSAGALSRAREECWSPKFTAEFTESGRIDKRGDGRLKIWQEPKPGEQYVIGADVAEGLAKGDYSVADVSRVSDGMQVAQFHGHIEADRFGVFLNRLGMYYRKALIGVERNNHGLTTITKLRDLGYPEIYVQHDLEHSADEKLKKKIGWQTTEMSKAKIIDQMAAALRDKKCPICDTETIQEMGTFVIDEHEKMGAKPGCFDDRVMARAIGLEMLRHTRMAPIVRSAMEAVQSAYQPLDKVAGY